MQDTMSQICLVDWAKNRIEVMHLICCANEGLEVVVASGVQ